MPLHIAVSPSPRLPRLTFYLSPFTVFVAFRYRHGTATVAGLPPLGMGRAHGVWPMARKRVQVRRL